MSASTPFQHLEETNQLLEVDVDDLKVWLPDLQKRGIGTRGLNGCTCIVLLGEEAILMAHVSPISAGYQKGVPVPNQIIAQTSIEHHDFWLTKVAEKVKEHAEKFPASTTAWGIFSINSEGFFVEGIFQQVKDQLAKMGFSMIPEFYHMVLSSVEHPAKGEAVAFFRNGVAELYLEDRKLWPQTESSARLSLPTEKPS